MSWRFLQVGCAVSVLALACGGATKQGAEQQTAGGPGGGGGMGPSAGSPTAGAPLVEEPDPTCFKPEELPERWSGDGSAGATSSECPIALDPYFSISTCYFVLADPTPASTPPESAGECCYWLTTLHCR